MRHELCSALLRGKTGVAHRRESRNSSAYSGIAIERGAGLCCADVFGLQSGTWETVRARARVRVRVEGAVRTSLGCRAALLRRRGAADGEGAGA